MGTIISKSKCYDDNYETIKKYVAGIALYSNEAKILHTKSSCSIDSAYVSIKNNIAYAVCMTIHNCSKRNIMLLLNKKEIINIATSTQKGMFCKIVSIEKYNNLFKINIAIVRRIKSNDKRIKRKLADKEDRKIVRNMISGIINV